MLFPVNFWLLLAVNLVILFLGIKKNSWVMSAGADCVFAIDGILLFFLYKEGMTLWTLLCCLFLILYNILVFIDHVGALKYCESSFSGFNVFATVWSSTFFLLRVCGLLYCLNNGAEVTLWSKVGVVIMGICVFLECLQFLRRRCRVLAVPLYNLPVLFNEDRSKILFWAGLVIFSITGIFGVGQWILVLLGYILMILGIVI